MELGNAGMAMAASPVPPKESKAVSRPYRRALTSREVFIFVV
jgi:hypothetical protein